MSSLYNLKNLRYSYQWNQQDVEVLKGLSFQFNSGCFSCVVGPSGSGKTTLLNLLGMIDSPSQGELQFKGQNITGLTETQLEELRLKEVGYIFQSFHLIPTLTVLENTSYFLPLLGMDNLQMKKHAVDILDMLGLKDHLNKRPLELSGGQRQRVAIARALAKKPSVILADEPTANLDSETATKIILAFKELQKSENTSFIFSTHDAHLVSYASEIYKMKDGQLQVEKGGV